jgi:hypothetical protein
VTQLGIFAREKGIEKVKRERKQTAPVREKKWGTVFFIEK